MFRIDFPTLTTRDKVFIFYWVVISIPFALIIRAVTNADVENYGILITEIGLLLFVLIWWLTIDTLVFQIQR